MCLSAGIMINDLQNINNMRATHRYIKVEDPKTKAGMNQESALFENGKSFHQPEDNLFDGKNEYQPVGLFEIMKAEEEAAKNL